MEETDFLNGNSIFERQEAQYEILDVDDGRGNVEQVIATNEPFSGLSAEQEHHADDIVSLRYGRYRPLFNGVIVIGPQVGKVFISFLGFVALDCVMIFLHEVICNEIGAFVFYIGQILLVLCVLFLLWTSVTDPGVVPRDFNLGQYLFEIRNNNANNPPTRPRWCRKCQSARPPRCYHCRDCDICVRRQDMHLLLGGVCVGSRNFKQYFAFNLATSLLSIYLLSVSLTLVIKLLHKYSAERAFMRSDFNLSCVLLFCGATVLSFPQTGLVMFVYRLYLLSRGSTVREEYRAYLRGNDYNPYDTGILLNLWEFIGKTPEKSCFRRKKNQVDPDRYTRYRWRIATGPHRRDSQIIYTSPLGFHDANLVRAEPQSYVEKETLRQQLNVQAKVKSHLSLPLLEHGELPMLAGTRFRLCLYLKPLDLLQQQIKQYHVCQALPKSISNLRKFKQGIHSLSESCLPETADSSDIVHQARAFQIQQIIGCVIRRDRLGLIELARRIDVAGLIGMERFDPDDIQMIELTNGLPLITARSQTRRPLPPLPPVPGTQQSAPLPAVVTATTPPVLRRINNNALGIPQMVAAGLMPTIRRQQQQVAASLALSRLHNTAAVAPNTIHLSPTTISTSSRTGNNVVYVPPAINRQSIFRYDQYNRRRFGLGRNNVTNTNVSPTRPTLPVRPTSRQKTAASSSNSNSTEDNRLSSGTNNNRTALYTTATLPASTTQETASSSQDHQNSTHLNNNSSGANAVCSVFLNNNNNQVSNSSETNRSNR